MTVVLAVLLAVTTPTPSPGDQAGAGTAVMRAVAYVESVDAQNVTAIEQAVHELLEQTAVFVAAVTPPPPPPPTRPPMPPAPVLGTGGGGDCYAGPIPAYIVTRESGGNPYAVNRSSGAYGCFQIMPFVWDANCAGLDRGVAGQIECANRISNGGSNLQPWALTR